MGDTNFFLPSPSQRTLFPVVMEAELFVEQNKIFHHRTDHMHHCCEEYVQLHRQIMAAVQL